MMHYQRRRRRRCHDIDTKKEAGQYDAEKGCNNVRRLTVAIANLALIATLSSMSASSSSSSSSSIGMALGFCSHHRYQRQHRQRPPSSFLSAVGVTASASSSVISVPPPNSRMGRRNTNYLTRQNYISSSSSSSCDTDQYFGCGTIDDGADADADDDFDENNSSSSSSSSLNMLLVDEKRGVDSVRSSSASSPSPANITNNYTTTNTPTRIHKRSYSILSRYRRRQLLRSSSSSRRHQLQQQQQNNNNLTTTSTTPASIPSRPRRKSSSSNISMSRLEYEQRKAAWAAKYTSVTTLRATFGTNRNKFWGDFDACNTRKLYHTLLPRALLELRILRDGLINYSDTATPSSTTTTSEKNSKKKMKMRGERSWWWWWEKNQVGGQQRQDERMRINNVVNDVNNNNINNEEQDEFVMDNITYLQQELKELAPLAFRARLAAKEYARERSRLPGRIGSMLYDGYRSWIKYGKWKSSGMTWEQVWNKYEDQVLNEVKNNTTTTTAEQQQQLQQQQMFTTFSSGRKDDDVTAATTTNVEIPAIASLLGRDDYSLNDEELTARICLRILERSVVTNDAIDRLFLKRRGAVEDDDIQQQQMQQQEQQVNDVGDGSNSSTSLAGSNSNIKDGIVIVDGMSKRQQRKRKRKLLLQEQKRRRKLRIQADLQSIEKKFDEDIQELLRYSYLSSTDGDTRRNSRHDTRRNSRRKQRRTYFWERDELKSSSSSSSISGSTVGGTDDENIATDDDDDDDDERKVMSMKFDTRNNIDDAFILGNVQNTISSSPLRKLSTNDVATLRTLVKTRKRLTQLLRRMRLNNEDKS